MVDSVNNTGGAGKAFASTLIPGLGQFIDGRNKQGALYMGGTVGLGVAIRKILKSLDKDAFETSQQVIQKGKQTTKKGKFNVGEYLNQLNKNVKKTKIKGHALIGLIFASAALWITNIVDAAIGDKSKKQNK